MNRLFIKDKLVSRLVKREDNNHILTNSINSILTYNKCIMLYYGYSCKNDQFNPTSSVSLIRTLLGYFSTCLILHN